MKLNAEIVDDVSGLFCNFISLLLQNIKHAHCHGSYFSFCLPILRHLNV